MPIASGSSPRRPSGSTGPSTGGGRCSTRPSDRSTRPTRGCADTRSIRRSAGNSKPYAATPRSRWSFCGAAATTSRPISTPTATSRPRGSCRATTSRACRWSPSFRPGAAATSGRTTIQRPRFVGITEFGPNSLVYHEGRGHRVRRVILKSGDQRADTANSPRRRSTSANECGAAHVDPRPDLCHSCGASARRRARDPQRLPHRAGRDRPCRTDHRQRRGAPPPGFRDQDGLRMAGPRRRPPRHPPGRGRRRGRPDREADLRSGDYDPPVQRRPSPARSQERRRVQHQPTHGLLGAKCRRRRERAARPGQGQASADRPIRRGSEERPAVHPGRRYRRCQRWRTSSTRSSAGSKSSSSSKRARCSAKRCPSAPTAARS